MFYSVKSFEMKTTLLLTIISLKLALTSCFAQYISSTVLQSFNPTVNLCAPNQVVLKIEIEIGPTPVTLTNLAINTNGTSSPNPDISNAKLYYYNDSTSLNLNQAVLLGTCYNPWTTAFSFLITPMANYSGMSSFSSLAPGKNYFWVTYDISCMAMPGNFVGACFESVSANGNAFIPLLSCPGGYPVIVNPTGLNENSDEPIHSIYPVPSNGNISIQLNMDLAKTISIELLDITGKKLDLLFEGIPEENELNFSLEKYPSGIYMIRSSSEGKVRLNKVAVL